MELFDIAVAHAKQEQLLLEQRDCLHASDGELTGEGARKAKVQCANPSGNLIIWGSGSVSNTSNIRISGTGNVVVIGAGTRFTDSTVIVLGSNSVFWFGALSTVGSLTAQIAAGTKFMIGDECMLSTRIIGDTTDHHGIYDLASGERINPVASIHVGNHVWLGRDVSLGKGSRIGSGSVIGQRSLVNGHACAASDNLYAGVPAKLVRPGIAWSRMSSSTYSEMEKSHRHAEYVQRREALRERCFAFNTPCPEHQVASIPSY
ncbi:putative acyl transferase [Bordetella ansorpii]|uniref:Putative acyl transferase n=1 Tax=Bordetella ansorpii TaxID=288768 RepID=A0A157MB18_9BORD|nr:hypothetical protein [Bordetella ansorpii]SAI05759.1 putative acyl transferase [Bordetella ansorpii]